MAGDEILTSVLGEKTRYVRGKGYGKKPPKKSRLQQENIEARVSSAMAIMRQEMQTDMDQKLQEDREKMAEELQRKLDEECVHMSVEFQEQMAAFMTSMQQAQGS
ncbi:hypothetical protein K7X08_032448 [Anisodus acutangulus]|uniref:Uncharacterized protein n=1 Tax=Anisodus acutangulus TaxID=402998 RepID=A0A9Q1N0K4_9SOLA|nr:hypothetical protein K7X08_032448 [Anisodus acutangulus]